jgi:hypothetical protein
MDNEERWSNWNTQRVIRWRSVKGEHGYERQSNTHLVKWSDGSSSLFIGKECFDMAEKVLLFTNIIF